MARGTDSHANTAKADGGIYKLRNVLQHARVSINPDLALQQLLLYIAVGQHDGVTQTDLAEELKMTRSSVSRNLIKLGLYFDDTRQLHGYDLVKMEPDMYERRRLACFLTPKGKKIFSEILDILKH